jgi:hypothetical protein
MEMGRRRLAALLIAAAFLAAAWLPVRASAANGAQVDADMAMFVGRLEAIVQSGDTSAYMALLTDDANRNRAREFAASELPQGATRSVLRERDRQPLASAEAGTAYVLQMDVLSDMGERGRVATWRMTVQRVKGRTDAGGWGIADAMRVSAVGPIYRLSVDVAKPFRAANFTVAAEDFELSLGEGTVFLVNVDEGTTGLVLLGNGTLHVHPAPRTEQRQLEIFCGRRALDTGFESAFVRLHPSDAAAILGRGALRPATIDARAARRAQEVFRDEAPKSFAIDLGDLSPDRWSVLPGDGDLLAEIRTRQFNTLTYARSRARAEDVGLFDRARRHTIVLYASQEKLESRGRFYDEDDLSEYDIVDYDVDIASTPDRDRIDGTVRLDLRVLAPSLTAVVLRLADSLAVTSVVSREFGRLFAMRGLNENTLVVNLPEPRPQGSTVTLTISYAGRLAPRASDQEIAQVVGDPQDLFNDGFPSPVLEPSYLYRNRDYWYPQGAVTDYATATIRVSVPSPLAVMASGDLQPGYPKPSSPPDGADRVTYLFRAAQPVRYLSFLVTRLDPPETTTVTFPPKVPGGQPRALALRVGVNPQQASRARRVSATAADIVTFYESILGDAPYPTLALALIDSSLPGGYSPAYLAVVNQPLPGSRLNWHGDPAAFSGYGDFFLAHEIAHQWWGQAVGWRNYHEQWLSEGFAQYFAALYARHERGDEQFGSMLRQFRKWAIDESDQGPVYLGFRLGHIRGDSRVFRALVYNKGAAVLHMLRLLVGDAAFFDGLRRFYRASLFEKAGTDDLQAAMEAASGMPLGRFFERWIYSSTLPVLQLTYRVEGSTVVLRLEQRGPEIFDVPVSLVLRYADGSVSHVLVPVTAAVVEQREPLRGPLKTIDANEDDGVLAEIETP